MQVVRLPGLRTWKVLIPLLCLAPGIAHGAVEDFVGKPIGLIAFDPSQQPLTPQELAGILPLQKNEPLRLSAVREAIEKLYATGRYSDIVVEASLEKGLVALRFVTKGTWFVGWRSVGSVPSPPSPEQLENSTDLDLGAPFYSEDLKRAADSLRKALASNGYFHTEIQSEVQHQPRIEQANIHFGITPGKRAHFGPPVIKGDLQRPESSIVKETHWKGWFGWQPITEDRVQGGVERVLRSYRKRDYLMARVILEGSDSKTGSPTLEITPGPKVQIEATGAKVSRGRLQSLVPVFEEQSVDRDLLMEGARRLTEYFQTQGYFDAKVTFSSSPITNGRLRILYTIDQGERRKLVAVEIKGNHYFDLKTLREHILMAPASFEMRRGRYSSSLLEHDLDSIAALYRANGFRDVRVNSEVLDDYRGKKDNVAVVMDVHEGPQWRVSGVEFEGASPKHEQALRSTLKSGPGQPFSEANVASDRDSILAYYFNRGYLNASFEWSYKESSAPDQVDLRFMITEGPQRFVREVLIGGLKTTRPQVVEKRVEMKAGDPLSQAQMLETQRRLYDLGIFAQVDMAIQNPAGNEPDKYVLLQLDESRKYSVAVGFGAEVARIGGSQTSLDYPAGQAGFSPSVSFDFSRLNFLGRAQTVTLRTALSNVQQQAYIVYTAPQIRGHQNLDLSFTALFDASQDVRTFSARRWEGSTQLAQRWTRTKTLFYRFAYRRVSVDQATLKIQPELIPLLSQPVRVGVLSASYLDDRRNNPVDTTRGTYNSLDLGTASRIFGSETDYFRLLGRNSTYTQIGRQLVFARTTSFGFMHTLRRPPGIPPGPQDIPLPERFFAGGAYTDRAFPENQAGPRDPVTGFPIGGKALLIFQNELRFPLHILNLGGVLFHDFGNVYSGLEDISFRVHQRDKTDFDYMVHGVGLGFRYRTPIGPVRADFAFVPNSPRFHGCQGTEQELLFGTCVPTDQRLNRFQFHFSLGQTF